MASRTPPPSPAPEPSPRDDNRDLGFGSVVATESRRRLLNPDGSFSVERYGLGWRASAFPYAALLTMSWTRFLAGVVALYLVINTLFAAGYLLCGPGALGGSEEEAALGGFPRAFFFSVETFSTVGYGHTVPVGLGAHSLMTVESVVGLLTVALVTGMAFARFSRPVARILFSRHAVIAPFEGGSAFMFRIANQRKSQLIEVGAQVIFSRFEESDGRRIRRFYPLALRRQKVSFFPLAWTIVHPIDRESPLAGMTEERCLSADAEFLVLLTATDEIFSQPVHARSSYVAREVVWNARFTDIFDHPVEGRPIGIDISRLHEIEAAEPPGQTLPGLPGVDDQRSVK